MTSQVWQVDPPNARLATTTLDATIEADFPQRGLFNLRVDGNPIDAQLLRVPVQRADATEAAVEDLYARDGDLIGTYPEREDRPYRVSVYWRTLPARHVSSKAVVELMLSVQTSRLDILPELCPSSRLPAQEVWWLTDPTQPEFKQLSTTSGHPLTANRERGVGCFLFRLPGVELSYAEMIPPTDFAESTIERTDDEVVEIRHRLFAQRLEKGVIVRARVRGVFLDRQGDAINALEWYENLCGSSLPLTV